VQNEPNSGPWASRTRVLLVQTKPIRGVGPIGRSAVPGVGDPTAAPSGRWVRDFCAKQTQFRAGPEDG
jgi:hypothetical protein